MTLRSDEEIFYYFRDKLGYDGDNDISAIALFAYAIIEAERFEWMEHVQKDTQTKPDSNQIASWYAGKPQIYFDRKEQEANRWFSGFARILLSDEISDLCNEAATKAVGDLENVIEKNLRWTKNFWLGFWSGIAANVGFTIILLAFVWIINRDFSVIAWFKSLVG